MKGGAVVSIRVNPQDVMAAIDIIEAAGVYVRGMSLAQCVKLAFEGMAQDARSRGVIPVRDGFEYASMVQRFTGVSQSRKRGITEVFEANSVARAIADKPHAVARLPQPQRKPDVVLLNEDEALDNLIRQKARLYTRIEELKFKQKADPANFDASEHAELTMKQHEVAELEKL